MSIYGGPDTVTDGLVLYLDAANAKSYAGTGTSWNDLSNNNNNGTIINSPIFTTNSNGTFLFGSTNKRVQISNQDRSILSCSIWFKKANANSVWPRDRLLLSVNSGGWGITFEDDNFLYFTRVGFSSVRSTKTITDTNWHNITVTFSGTQACFYIDGSLDICRPYNFTPNSSGGSYTIASRGSGSEFFEGEISQVAIYNKVLNANEVKLNYDAIKGRFGL